MMETHDGEYVTIIFIENNEIDKVKLYVENSTLEIENYVDAYTHELNYHKVMVEGLSKLKTLNRLILSRFNLENFVTNNPIPTSITDLHLINCRFKDLTCIRALTQLESFTFTITPGALGSYQFTFKNSDYSIFQSLKTIGLSGVLLRKIPSFDRLENLERLYLIGNRIPKIENLEQFSSLKELHLQYNEIKKIENLESLVHLKRLYLYNNRIKRFEGLDKMRSLKYLDLNYNLFFQANEYQMPRQDVQKIFGHLKQLVMLNGHLYPDNDFYTFLRRGEDMNTWI